MDWFIYELCTVLAGFSIATQNGLGPSILPAFIQTRNQQKKQRQIVYGLASQSFETNAYVMTDTNFQPVFTI